MGDAVKLFLVALMCLLLSSVAYGQGRRACTDTSCLQNTGADLCFDAVVGGACEQLFTTAGDIRAGRCIEVGGVDGTGTCICRESGGRLFSDDNCNGPTKEGGEEYLDNAAGGGGGGGTSVDLELGISGSFNQYDVAFMTNSGLAIPTRSSGHDRPPLGVVVACSGAFPCVSPETATVRVIGQIGSIDTTVLGSGAGDLLCALDAQGPPDNAKCPLDTSMPSVVGHIGTYDESGSIVVYGGHTRSQPKIIYSTFNLCTTTLDLTGNTDRGDLCINTTGDTYVCTTAGGCDGSGWVPISSAFSISGTANPNTGTTCDKVGSFYTDTDGDTTVKPSGPVFYRCTATGSPGTWQALNTHDADEIDVSALTMLHYDEVNVRSGSWLDEAIEGIDRALHVNTRVFGGNDTLTSHYQNGWLLYSADTARGPVNVSNLTSSEHTALAVATYTSGQTAVPQTFSCWGGNAGGSPTGTCNANLVVYEDGNDSSAEQIGSISFVMPGDNESIKQDTTFSAISSVAPYFFGVKLADGGSCNIPTNFDLVCEVTWYTY